MSNNIVISFSNKDRAFVQELTELLDQRLSRYRTVRGAEDGDGRPRVWIYPQQTDGSRHIIEIHRQLEQALAVIVVLSDHSAASRWVLEEIQVAWNANKLIIPIVIGDRAVIKQRDVGKLLSTRMWIYAEELDSTIVAASIVNTLVELGRISKADIGNRYRHKRQLTTRPTGGFFEATRDDNEHLFVVKEVASSDREVLRELDAKVARLQQLRNPALPLIDDYLQEKGRRYLVWEEVPGRHMGDVLAAQKGQPLTWADIQPWVADALTTLAFLHQARVLHLGLKPQNLKLTRDGQIKLLDIGLDRRPAGVAGVGTTDPYLAPELLDERDPSPRSDLYAAGAVLYTLLTGDRQPSPAKPPVAKRNREVPEHVSQAIAKAMSPEPSQRFRSASEFLVALEGAQVPVGTQPKRPAWLISAGAAALVGLLALVLLLPRLLPGSQSGANASTAEAPTEAAPTSAPVAATTVEAPQTLVPTAATSAQVVSGQACLSNCWRINDTARTLTWTGPEDGSVQIYQGAEAIDKLRAGYTAVFTTTVPGQINACVLTDNGVQVRGSCGEGLYFIWPGTYRMTSSGSTAGAGGFLWKPYTIPASFADAMAFIRSDLEYTESFDPQRGRLVETISEPKTILLEQNGNRYGTQLLVSSATDFVLHASFVWGAETDQCELVFRKGNSGRYTAIFRPNGEILATKPNPYTELDKIRAKHLNLDRSESNAMVLIAKGDIYRVYVNSELELEFTDPTYTQGFFDLAAYDFVDPNAAPRPSCTFSDVWVWAPNGP